VGEGRLETWEGGLCVVVMRPVSRGRGGVVSKQTGWFIRRFIVLCVDSFEDWA
jgi:hypothetical protein